MIMIKLIYSYNKSIANVCVITTLSSSHITMSEKPQARCHLGVEVLLVEHVLSEPCAHTLQVGDISSKLLD